MKMYESDTSTPMNFEGIQEGDSIDVKIQWFDDRNVSEMVVKEKTDYIPEISCKGNDGNTYRIQSDGKVICPTDNKKGSHRGNVRWIKQHNPTQ